MEAFHWDSTFFTGLSKVDTEHRELVDIINQFGKILAENRIVLTDVDELFQKLASYAHNHFKNEEAMMADVGIDPRHLKIHTEAHRSFLQEVSTMYSLVSQDNLDSAKQLLNFLSHWLAYHILGMDQNMAQQIKVIQSGVDPVIAYDSEEKEGDKATAPLLIALNGLFEQVSARNKALTKLNNSLEEKVALRTKELSEANLHLEELSLTDVLTSLPNRRYAMRSLAALWHESIEADLPLACIMIDADHFKAVNDNYGHDAGDAVLTELAKTLQHAFRTDDIVCRLGGDEFFVICPNTDQAGGMHIAELVRQAVSALRVPTDDKSWHGSISVGVGVRTPEMTNYDALIKAADKGVYAAKEAGKNCVKAVN